MNANTKAINEGVLPKVQYNNDLEQTVQQMPRHMQRHLVSKDRPFEEKNEAEIDKNQEEQNATMEEISASAHVLSDMTESLKSMIDVFVLETGR